jgi:hypothetical protein
MSTKNTAFFEKYFKAIAPTIPLQQELGAVPADCTIQSMQTMRRAAAPEFFCSLPENNKQLETIQGNSY